MSSVDTDQQISMSREDLTGASAHKSMREINFDHDGFWCSNGVVGFGFGTDSTPVSLPLKDFYGSSTLIESHPEAVLASLSSIGCLLLDQCIKRQGSVFFIGDGSCEMIPNVMCDAALGSGRMFFYLDLTSGIGRWSPFAGGTFSDSSARIEQAFDLNLSSSESRALVAALGRGRHLEQLKQAILPERLSAIVDQWLTIDNFSSDGTIWLSIENALRNNASVYVKCDFSNPILVRALECFVMEFSQETFRLRKSRSSQASMFISSPVCFFSRISQFLSTCSRSKRNYVLFAEHDRSLYKQRDIVLDLLAEPASKVFFPQQLQANRSYFSLARAENMADVSCPMFIAGGVNALAFIEDQMRTGVGQFSLLKECPMIRLEDVLVGFGQYLTDLRGDLNLTQAELSDVLEIGTTRLRQYESGNIDDVGASGFPISIIVKLANFNKQPLNTVLQDIIRRSPGGLDRSKRFNADRAFEKLSALIPLEMLKEFDWHSGRKSKALGDLELSWALEMARKLLLLSDQKRLAVEFDVLKHLVGTDHFGGEEKDRFNLILNELHKIK